MKSILLLWITVLFYSLQIHAQQYDVTTILQNGSPEKTYNLVVVAEAYTKADFDLFINSSKLIDDILAENPVYADMLDKMNIYAISTPSVDSSISLVALNPNPNAEIDPIQTSVPKNTFFNINYQNSYRAYSLKKETIVKARRVAAEHVPFTDSVLILVNGSQGQPLSGVASTNGFVAVVGVKDSFNKMLEKHALIHELGHSIGGLSDEYALGKEEGFNKTTNNDPNTIRWKDLLHLSDVGIESTIPEIGVYIPNLKCTMNTFNHTYFCPVCQNRMKNITNINENKKLPYVHRMYAIDEDEDALTYSYGWDKIPGATNYEVTFKDFGNRLEYTEITNTNQIVFKLSRIPKYSGISMTIRAYNDSYSSVFKQFIVPVRSRYNSEPFEVPSTINITNISDTSFKAEWKSNTKSLATLIRLWNSTGEFSEIITDQDFFVFNNLTKNGKYKMEIAAVNPYDHYVSYSSPFSNKIEIDLGVFNTQAPIANFESTKSCNSVTFKDISLNTVISYLWDFGDGTKSTEKNPTHTYTKSDHYKVLLKVSNNSGSDTKEISVNIIAPSLPNTITEQVNLGKSTTINLPGTNGYIWYDNQIGGNLIGMGSTYTTPTITENQTYYVSATTNQTVANVGLKNIDTKSGNIHDGGLYLVFDAKERILLKKAKVYAQGDGNRRLEVKDDAGNLLAATVMRIPDGESIIDINMVIPQGNNLRIGFTKGAKLFRNNKNAKYPYEVSDVLTIKKSSAPTNNYYYYLYDWQIATFGDCETKERTAIHVEVTKDINYSCDGVSEYDRQTQYVAGDKVVHLGKLYKKNKNGSWEFLAHCHIPVDPCHGVSEYIRGKVYAIGNRVTYKNKLYERTSVEWRFLATCGVTSKSALITTNESKEINSVSFVVYPNPVKQTLNVDIYNLRDRNSILSIKDINGRTLRTISLDIPMNEKVGQTVDMSPFATGVYFVQITGDKKTISQKIFKQ